MSKAHHPSYVTRACQHTVQPNCITEDSSISRWSKAACFTMPGGGLEALNNQFIENWNGSPQFDSQFDPMELWETRIPFVDPFCYDERTFRADAPAPPLSMNGASFSSLCIGLSMPTSQASPAAHPRFQDSDDPYQFQDPYHHQDLMLSQLAAIAIDTLPELPGVVLERVRLSPDQVIYIFQQRSGKTSRTAALLSAKFGVTPKAIRDIWTGRSWAHDTRPFWTGPHRRVNRPTRPGLTCDAAAETEGCAMTGVPRFDPCVWPSATSHETDL